MENNIAYPATGSIAGAGIYSTMGGVGLVGGFGGIGIGLVGMTTVGATVGFATFGVVEGIANGDSAAFISTGLGAFYGATVASTIGGVGVSFGGSAFGIGIGSMSIAGGVFGLGIYGLAKMFAKSETKETYAAVFERMEDKISYQDAYHQAMIELNPLFVDLVWEQQFSELEIEDELKMLNAQIKSNAGNCFAFNSQSIGQIPVGMEFDSAEIELQEKFSWQPIKTLYGHSNSINYLAIKNNVLASASNDHNINLWNINTGKLIYSFFGSHEVQAVAINNQIIAGTGFDQTITIWNLNDKTLKRIISKYKNPNSHNNVIYALIFSNKGELLISGSADTKIKVWNPTTGNLRFTLSGHSGSVNTLAISPCDRFLISGSSDQTIRIWDLINPEAKPHVIEQYSGELTAIAITSDGKHFISSSRHSCLQIWCMETQRKIYNHENAIDNINSINISFNNKLMAVGNTKGMVQIWDLETHNLLQSITACSPVVFNSDGKYLITGDIHNRIQIWQKMVYNSHLDYEKYLNEPWWKILGVSKTSPATNIKIAYYNLAKKYHSDVNSTQEAKDMMSIINRAYQTSQIKYS